MNWELRSCLALQAVFAAALRAADLSPTITVLMYNYAPIPSDVLVQTEAKVARIYQHCGIKIRWVNSPLSSGAAGQASDAELSPASTLLALRMLSRPMAERVRRAQETVGFVLSPEDGSFATVADVFAGDIEQLANNRGIPERILLGYIVTHELGHLLLGPGSHGTTGIMHSPWRVKELENIARGFMMFTPDEAERMRTNIRSRMSKSETGGAHTSNHSFE
jgi:hypothetical protein